MEDMLRLVLLVNLDQRSNAIAKNTLATWSLVNQMIKIIRIIYQRTY
jgi:hypothetical protein